MEIYYDGLDFAKFGAYDCVTGFTTNTALVRSSGKKNYLQIYTEALKDINGRPVSFQVWGDKEDEIVEQATEISKLGPNAVAKVPIVNSIGVSNVPVITRLVANGIKVNVTAVFTSAQIDELRDALRDVLPVDLALVVSIFSGRISDTGVDPRPTIRYSIEAFKSMPSVKILWAGCKDVTAITSARADKCHIVTVPGDILQRFVSRKGMDLFELSIDTAKMFRNEAIDGSLSIL
jgi:transaldolase